MQGLQIVGGNQSTNFLTDLQALRGEGETSDAVLSSAQLYMQPQNQLLAGLHHSARIVSRTKALSHITAFFPRETRVAYLYQVIFESCEAQSQEQHAT